MPEAKRKSVSDVTSPTAKKAPVDAETEQATPSSANTPALPPLGPLVDPAPVPDTKKAKKKYVGIFILLHILIGFVFL